MILSIVPTHGSIFFEILVLFIIISIPLLKFKLLKERNFDRVIIVLLSLWFVDKMIYLRYTLPNTLPPYERANIERAKSDIKTITTSIELFKADNYSFPTTQEGIQALISNPDPTKYKNWRGYLKKYPTDPWGNKYNYLSPGIHGDVDVYSFGIDGVQSEDDIDNWE